MQGVSLVFVVLALSACSLAGKIDFNVPCLYHYIRGSETQAAYEVYGMLKDGEPYYERYDFFTDPEQRALIRCDFPGSDKSHCFGIYETFDGKRYQCENQFYTKQGFIPTSFEYETVIDFACPSNYSTTGCKKYCNKQNTCFTLDPDNRVAAIYDHGEEQVVVWLSDPINVALFGGEKCDYTSLPDLINTCTPPGRIDTVMDCAYHYSYGTEHDTEMEFYGMLKDGQPYYEYVVSPDGTSKSVIRCDISDPNSEYPRCFGVYRSSNCVAQFEGAEFENFLFVEYDSGPFDVACPVNASGRNCKVYCNSSDYRCDYIDTSNNRIVAVQYRRRDPIIITWHDDLPTLDMFVDNMCNATQLPEAVDVCPPKPTPPAPASSTTPATQSSAVSAASMAQVTVAVIALALVVASLF